MRRSETNLCRSETRLPRSETGLCTSDERQNTFLTGLNTFLRFLRRSAARQHHLEPARKNHYSPDLSRDWRQRTHRYKDAMHIPSFIEQKRDGFELSSEEIAEFIRGFTSGEIPDYQASAWAMAVFFRGMSAAETSALTKAMMQSGRVLAHPAGSPPKVDKHSTGGIGDKVSLILAPLLACDGLWVPMISGRGLGITGGTLDKLESIPGFRVGLDEAESAAQLSRLGVVMIGQTATSLLFVIVTAANTSEAPSTNGCLRGSGSDA